MVRNDPAKFGERQLMRQAVQQRLVALEDAPIEVPDGIAEVACRDIVLVVEQAAAQYVEQDIRVVVDRYVFLGSKLECVTAGHEPRERVRARADRLLDCRRDGRRRAQLPAQCSDLCLGFFDVSDDLPAFRFTAVERDRRVDEVSASDTSLMPFLRDGGTTAKLLDLPGRHEHGRRFQAQAVDNVSLERFAGFGAVGYAGIQCEQGEAGVPIEFRPLVGIDEIARVRLREAWSPGREDVLQPVEEFDGAVPP